MQHTDLPFFVKTTIILTILISIIGVVNESLIAKNNFQSLVDGEIRNIEQSIRTDFSSLSKHLLSLSESPNLLTYISTPTPEAQTTAAEEFLNLARNNPRYDQIRYIDKDGTEKIRLDNEALSPQIAPNNLLQDKSTRYYVTDTLQLNKGEIYISPLDLKIDNGTIVTPYEPMIRFTTPIFNEANELAGMVIINYHAGHLLPERNLDSNLVPHAHMMLINSDGFWMRGRMPQEEWGYVVPNRSDKKFQNSFPETWNTIKANRSGFTISKEGMFSYTTVYPINEAQIGKVSSFTYFSCNLSVNDFFWVVASHVVPQDLLAGFYDQILYKYLLAIGIVSIVGFSLVGIQKVHLHNQREERKKKKRGIQDKFS